MRDMATRGRMAEEAMREIEARPTPAASPVAGVSALELLADVMHLWVDGYISKSPRSCADDSVSGGVFEKVASFLEAQEVEVDYCGWRRVAQPSAEGDGWIAVTERLPELEQVVDLWLGSERLTDCSRIYDDQAGGWLWCRSDGGIDDGVPLEAIGYDADTSEGQSGCVTHWRPLSTPVAKEGRES